MKRLPVAFAEAAADDLERIRSYVLDISKSEPVAEGLIGRLVVRARRIGDAPNAGRPVPDLDSRFRSVPFEGRAVIVYRVEVDEGVILKIFYGGQDYANLAEEHPSIFFDPED